MERSPIIDQLYDEYIILRYAGFSHEQTLQHFAYLHDVTMTRLLAKIDEERPKNVHNYVGIVDFEERRVEAAEEKTEPSIALDTEEELQEYRKSA